jgi:hypothetical protein
MIIASNIPKDNPAIEGGKVMKAIAIHETGDPGAYTVGAVL